MKHAQTRLHRHLRYLAFCLPLVLAACASTRLASPPSVSAPTPSQWQAPLPHNGAITDLTDYWQQQGDPLLAELIAAAQAVSPSVASARSRIAQSHATQVASGAALLPKLDATASSSRGRSQPFGGQGGAAAPGGFGGGGASPISTITQAGLQAAWEIDLWGGNRAARDAADERLAGAEAQWHDARVAVAAEVANAHYSLRTCRQQEAVTRADAASRKETARLSDLSTQAGFTAPATAALARASAAEASGRATQQSAACELDLKALVALTGLSEPDLKQKEAPAQYGRSQLAIISIATVPATALAQRPDVFNAAREVAAASADIGSAEAQRYPQLSLSGSIGTSRIRSAGVTTSLDTWSIGPLALTVPLFDGGRRAADVDAARARYAEAAALYRARVRQAVREVEEALVNLQSTAAREADVQAAVAGYQASFTGTEARYQSGLANLVELEDARRLLLSAQTTDISLQKERLTAAVSLYRAMGGGWAPEQVNAPAQPIAAITLPTKPTAPQPSFANAQTPATP